MEETKSNPKTTRRDVLKKSTMAVTFGVGTPTAIGVVVSDALSALKPKDASKSPKIVTVAAAQNLPPPSATLSPKEKKGQYLAGIHYLELGSTNISVIETDTPELLPVKGFSPGPGENRMINFSEVGNAAKEPLAWDEADRLFTHVVRVVIDSYPSGLGQRNFGHQGVLGGPNDIGVGYSPVKAFQDQNGKWSFYHLNAKGLPSIQPIACSANELTILTRPSYPKGALTPTPSPTSTK